MTTYAVDTTQWRQEDWDMWKACKQFPDLVAKNDYVLEFTLGRDDYGWEYATKEKRYTGPALDLTGATVKLKIRDMGSAPSYLQQARGGDWNWSWPVLTVTGVVTDETNGKVSFTLTAAQTDVLGQFFAQIQVEDSAGLKVIPANFRIKFLRNIFGASE